jgi:hypothetical protein
VAIGDAGQPDKEEDQTSEQDETSLKNPKDISENMVKCIPIGQNITAAKH